MQGTKKTDKALDALVQRYVDWLEQMWNKLPQKKKSALSKLAKGYFRLRDDLAKTGAYETLSCICKIDRLVLVTDELQWEALADMPGFRAQEPRRLWQKDYRRAQPICGTGSVEEVLVEYERTAPWFPHFRITVVPRDTTGLQEQDLRSILEMLHDFKIAILEVAWDFPAGSLMDLDYSRRFGIFGKTWLRPSRWGNPFHERWGTTSKIVRAYFKLEIFKFRVELQLNSKFLRKHGINDIFDFRKLPGILLPNHMEFAKLDEDKLIRALRRASLSREEQRRVFARTTQKAETRLWEALRYLRKAAHLENARRLLVSMHDSNRVVREALEKLVAEWPASPAQLVAPQ
jgi:hypothetical protein